jgi:hypothetical protein
VENKGGISHAGHLVPTLRRKFANFPCGNGFFLRPIRGLERNPFGSSEKKANRLDV